MILGDSSVVFTPAVEEGADGVDKEEEDEAEDYDLLNVNVEI